MANRKIVLTGGAGFLLSYVAETYAAMGDDVVMFDRTKRSDLPKYGHCHINRSISRLGQL